MSRVSRVCLLILAAGVVFAADDPWAKVRDLRSGTELRVYKKGVAQPVAAKMGELTDDNLVVILKNEQTAIAREQIDRIDYRPASGRVSSETKTKTTDPDYSPGPPGHGSRTPGSSTSSGLTVGSKPDFETIYKRPVPPPKKQ